MGVFMPALQEKFAIKICNKILLKIYHKRTREIYMKAHTKEGAARINFAVFFVTNFI